MKRQMSFFAVVLLCATIGAGSSSVAQRKKKHDAKATPSAEKSATDSTTAKKEKDDKTKLKKYEEVITKDVETSKGFITVHKKEDKYWFEIPFSIMGRDLLNVSRIAKASVDMRNGSFGMAGDEIGEAVYSFEKGPGNKLYLKRMSFSEYSGDSTKAMFAGVQKNNVQPLAAAFPIVAYNKDSSAAVIEVTDWLNADNDVLYFHNEKLKQRAGVAGQLADRSYIKYVHTFSKNLEVRALKTYSAGLNPAYPYYSLELNASFVLLPEKPMQGRLRDDRVGYFATGFKDFDANPQGVKEIVYAVRWRLEPKPEDVEKYKRGELVEPQKPIIFYIDPTTPKKWVPYLIAGVNDWQKAFEKAGFKNAIYAREAPSPQEDSTWSIDDATHSAIVYRPSVIANAMGPNVADPRSGEIIESHIFWYHNVMKLLHDWYQVQCGTTDSRARKREFDDELMGQLIRFVSSHEVGHTLGLMHNFGASSSVPVDSLRNKKWVEAHGHTPSIMDYARFNYVAQPEDNIGEAGLFPRINDYDTWAVQWGYTWRPEYKSSADEQRTLTKIVTDSLKNPRLRFGSELSPFDPRNQNEDLGDDAVKASGYGIKNLQRIITQIAAWDVDSTDDAEQVKEPYSAVLSQYQLYMGHVLKIVGGVYSTPKIGAEPGPVDVYVPRAKQKAALDFINKQFFNTPLWLNEKSMATRFANFNFMIEFTEMQTGMINALVGRNRISLLMEAEYADRANYGATEYLADLNKMIFAEEHAGKNVDVYRRNLQKFFVFRMLEQAFAKDDQYQILGPIAYHPAFSDFQIMIRDELKAEQAMFRQQLKNPALDKMTKAHLRDLDDKITRGFAIK
ncbi:hypothetical protein DCC81_05130 [Chitinophaga parva]|uniref:Zinc-dependent metalloprotease n=1 Tax=Chitinophaga parva TaxID=2169414 RepID=A0A2T7BMG0_9BACT|nr:zinc-dependent metalloprotease [Chitinophaga parva]PUZ28865.1 hypothetical protein DCC81_05130 [Chitinophaga parva]